MANKKGLGRGLDALLESYEPGKGPATLQEVSVYDIDTNPDQPRKTFDEEKLNELASSVKTHGIVQPLILYRQGDRYTIVAGERRYRAARLAGLKVVPAVITDKEEHELQEVSLIENLQREDLNPVEEAAAIRFLMVQHNLTQEEVSSRIGRSRPAVTNALRLLNLPDSVQGMLKEGTLSAGHGKMLAGLNDPDKAEKLAEGGPGGLECAADGGGGAPGRPAPQKGLPPHGPGGPSHGQRHPQQASGQGGHRGRSGEGENHHLLFLQGRSDEHLRRHPGG